MCNSITTINESRIIILLVLFFIDLAGICHAASIHSAAAAGDINKLDALISQGVSVETPTDDKRKDTPLYYAVVWGQIKATRFLLEHGANPNKINGIGYPPIHYADQAEENSVAILRILVKYGGNVDSIAENKTSLLQSMIQGEDVRAVEYLLEAGADPEIKGTFDEPIICTAIAHENIKVIALLVNQEIGLNHRHCYKGLSPLHKAKCNLEIVKTLVNAGAAPNILSATGKTPAQMAAKNQCAEVAEFLSN